jgi:deoxycytidine triphosphate deaminase
LLSDEIEFYINEYKLVDPPKRDNIMAASYELRVGKKCAIGDKVFSLSEGEVLTFPKFEVVVVEILETINMPDFLIGRWNIRTRWAYEGLIWVGGPQVNPGFRGKIMCPLWNLSDKEISIPYGEAIAVIDFSTTTSPTVKSNRLPMWDQRSRYIFEDYLKGLRSGLVTLVATGVEDLKIKTDQRIRSFENNANQRLESHQSRMDTFTSVTFSALGILVAAVAIIATKPAGEGAAPQYWWDPTIFWLCSITAILTLFAFLRPCIAAKTNKLALGLVAFLAVGSVSLLLLHQRTYEQARRVEINSLEKKVEDVDHKRAELEQKLNEIQNAKAPLVKH